MCAYGVVWLNEWIVDGNNLNVVELDGIAEDNAANATEAVDSDLSWCHFAVEVISFCVWMCVKIVCSFVPRMLCFQVHRLRGD